ncbi:MmcQ/YjbR family DNA-binding protein [Marinomonas epiphytica]
MNEGDVVRYLTNKPEAFLDYPFGPEPKVFKIYNKVFALVFAMKGKLFVNLKCDPEEAIQLRDIFPEVTSGYHMNKKHWNSIHLDGALPAGEIERMIDNSYSLVFASLKKTERQAMELKFTQQELHGRHGTDN